MTGTILLAGALAQTPRRGGLTWVFLQYLIGLRRLGWDVVFVDRLEPDMCVDDAGRRCTPEQSLNLRYFLDVMERFHPGGAFSLLCNRGEQTVGLARPELLERARGAAFLLNVMGFVTDEELLGAVPRRVFLDIDPGFGQMWRALGLADRFQGHDTYVTIGENIGQPNCPIPTCGLPWMTTPQPVVLAEWPALPPASSGPFTSVASWRGAYGPVEYEGVTYGLRVHEFRKFVELPSISGLPFELALDIDPSEERDLKLLDEHGWRLVDPRTVARDPDAYRAYIARSGAEFMVAKNMYVRANAGWLSDRSLCYLASGRPVLAQETGFTGLYPTGEGLLAFRTTEEAAHGAAAIVGDYARHARAAREIAEAHFDSDIVLARLLQQLGVA